MSYSLFITQRKNFSAKVHKNVSTAWSCKKSTQSGDIAFLYETGVGIHYEWLVTSNAKKNPSWDYVCQVCRHRSFNPPIRISEIQNAIPRSIWSPPHTNFRGYKALSVPDEVARKIRTLRPSPSTPTIDTFNAKLENGIRKSLALSKKQRRARLSNAPVKPTSSRVTATVFNRNPDVIAEVLCRANGYCETCRQPAPFIRAKDKTPYLEIHHRKRLCDGGDDTIENSLALCPNCHRKAHFGIRKRRTINSQEHS